MAKYIREKAVMWLVIGVLIGVGVLWFRPQQTVYAVTTDRNEKFAVATCEMTGGIEGVFVLDFLTGQLRGAVLNTRTGKFQFEYTRNIALDFDVDSKAEPYYTIVSGRVGLPATGGVTPAAGTIYVAELSSGRVNAYMFPYREQSRGTGRVEMRPLDTFQFREATE